MKGNEGDRDTASEQIVSLRRQIAQLQSQLKTKENVNIHIEIQQLTLEQFQLDDLSFTLDQLDIKDLGGTLNLGNNFTRRVSEHKKHQVNKRKRSEKTESSVAEEYETGENNSKKSNEVIIKLNNQQIPYSWTN